MKKIFLLSLACCMLAFTGCSKDDSPKNPYSDKQQKALAIFSGTWADIQFSNLGSYPGAHLQPNPDKIIFESQYDKPLEIYKDDYINGNTLLFSAFGELVYHNEEYEDVSCYYWLSESATELRLYRKDTKVLYNKYGLSIKDETKFNLQDSNITLPYIFVKQ